MATPTGKATARRAVLAEVASRGWNPAALADAAGIDYGTAGDFLNGKRWPKVATLGKIDVALGWTPGTLAAIGEELQDGPADSVSAAPHNGSTLLFRRPDGLTDAEWERVKDDAGGYIEWLIERAARER